MSNMSSMFSLLSALIAVQLLLVQISANQYDPHLYPEDGPFFEGWYARLTDSDNSRSLGVLFGRVLPKSNSAPKHSMTYLSFIRSNGDNESMEVIDIFPEETNISVTVRNGQQVVNNPDNASPAYFEWIAKPYGYFNVTPNSTVFDFQAHGIRFIGSFGKPVPWGPNGEGPEGWLENLPFVPLHWFVYSVATSGNYSWTNDQTAEKFSGKATMHQEKNWGNSFPPSWIWTEGVNATQSTTYAGSFGVVQFGPLNIPAHLYGYRNFKKNITVNLRPDNSYVKKTIDGCQGKVSLTIFNPLHKVEINIKTPSSTLNKCLFGPTVEGFKQVCVESFVATTETIVYKLDGVGFTKVDYSIFKNSALEFGGDYMCKSGPC